MKFLSILGILISFISTILSLLLMIGANFLTSAALSPIKEIMNDEEKANQIILGVNAFINTLGALALLVSVYFFVFSIVALRASFAAKKFRETVYQKQ